MRRLLGALLLVMWCGSGAKAASEWAGSGACAECHRDIFLRYMRTPMARSSGEVSAVQETKTADKSVFLDAKSGYTYSVGQRDRGYVLHVRQNAAGGVAFDRELRYFVGSGAVARTFLLDVGNFLYESPATYYGQRGAWDFSPGYAAYSYPFLTRAIAPGCLACHATQVRPITATQNGYESPPFGEPGVGCERCHGPGATHARTGRRADIVNPAKLAAERRDSVCAQCHLSGEIRVERAGRSQLDFRAGNLLSDYSVAFVTDDATRDRRVTSHVENLAASACARASGARMWCGSCHDAHSLPSPSQRVGWFRSKCLSCHAAADCGEAASVRAARRDDCTACHMPKATVSDAEHVVYTDHSIRRHPNVDARALPLRSDASLIPFGGVTASQRDLGLAYAIVALRGQNAAWRTRAFELLAGAQVESPDEPETLAYLADIYRGRGEDAKAEPLYERLSQVAPGQAASWVALGGYAFERGNDERAIALWNKALAISPALVLVRMNQAIALARTGHREEAMATLRRALEFNPTFEAGRKMLGELAR